MKKITAKSVIKNKNPLFLQLCIIGILALVTIFAANQTIQQQILKSKAQTLVNCDVATTELVMTASELKFLGLLNAYRLQNGAPAMAISPILKRSAEWQSNHMATGGPFSHTDATGRNPSTRIKNCGFTGNATAENIAYNKAPDSATRTFDQWKNSPGHNRIMLNATYTQVGIAEKVGANGNHYWTLNAASGLPIGTVPTEKPAPPTQAPTQTPVPPTPTQIPVQPTQPLPTIAPTNPVEPPEPEVPTPTFACLGACPTVTPPGGIVPTEHPLPTQQEHPSPTEHTVPTNIPVPTTPPDNGGSQPHLPADQGLFVLIILLIVQLLRGIFGGF